MERGGDEKGQPVVRHMVVLKYTSQIYDSSSFFLPKKLKSFRKFANCLQPTNKQTTLAPYMANDNSNLSRQTWCRLFFPHLEYEESMIGSVVVKNSPRMVVTEEMTVDYEFLKSTALCKKGEQSDKN